MKIGKPNPETLARCAMMLLASPDNRRVTAFLAGGLTLKVSRVCRPDGRLSYYSLIVSYGRPNYAERQIMKRWAKSGHPEHGSGYIDGVYYQITRWPAR